MASVNPLTLEEWDHFRQQAVACPRCHWSGTIAACDPVPDEVVLCPSCGKAVEITSQPIRFREFL